MKLFKSREYPTRDIAIKNLKQAYPYAKYDRRNNRWTQDTSKIWVDSSNRVVTDFGKVKKKK